MDNAVVNMIFQDQTAGRPQRSAHRGKLNQNFRAVPPAFNHSFHGFQMADRAGQAVHDFPCVFVRMKMCMMFGKYSFLFRVFFLIIHSL